MGGHECTVPVNNLPAYKGDWGMALADMHRPLNYFLHPDQRMVVLTLVVDTWLIIRPNRHWPCSRTCSRLNRVGLCGALVEGLRFSVILELMYAFYTL